MFPGLIGGKSPPREGSPRSAKISKHDSKGILFFFSCLFLVVIFLLCSPRPDQDLEEPPSKRLTEPADILRMPVSFYLCILLIFSLFILLKIFTFHMMLAGIGRPLLPPSCTQARTGRGHFSPKEKRLPTTASKAHPACFQLPSFPRSCVIFILILYCSRSCNVMFEYS